MEQFLKSLVLRELERLTEDNKPLPKSVEMVRNFEGLYNSAFYDLFSEFLTAKLKQIATSPIEEIRISLKPFSVSVFYNLNGFSVVKNISYGEKTPLIQSEEGFRYGLVVRKGGNVVFSKVLIWEIASPGGSFSSL